MTSREQITPLLATITTRLTALSFKNAVKGLSVANQFHDGSYTADESDRISRLVESIEKVLEIIDEDN